MTVKNKSTKDLESLHLEMNQRMMIIYLVYLYTT